MIIALKIIPSSCRNEVVGLCGDFVKIKIAAPPEKNAANLELIKFLSDKLNISKDEITLISGFNSKNKRVEIKNANEKSVFTKLGIEKNTQMELA